jgi:hypothetical protein
VRAACRGRGCLKCPIAAIRRTATAPRRSSKPASSGCRRTGPPTTEQTPHEDVRRRRRDRGLCRARRACANHRQVRRWHVRGGTPLNVLRGPGGWAGDKVVQRCAQLAPDHLAPWTDRLAIGGEDEGAGGLLFDHCQRLTARVGIVDETAGNAQWVDLRAQVEGVPALRTRMYGARGERGAPQRQDPRHSPSPRPHSTTPVSPARPTPKHTCFTPTLGRRKRYLGRVVSRADAPRQSGKTSRSGEKLQPSGPWASAGNTSDNVLTSGST